MHASLSLRPITALCLWSSLGLAGSLHADCEVSKVKGSMIGSKDEFAQALDVDGDTALVGCFKCDAMGGESGAAYVYVFDGFGWQEQALLAAPDGVAFDQMGSSVGISGDWAVAGASKAHHSGLADAGAVYVFRRTAGTWSAVQKITPGDPVAGQGFGNSVSIQGNRLAIGAHKDDDQGASSGSVYVYRLPMGGIQWAFEQKLLASDGLGGDRFGQDVDLDQNSLAIGAHFKDVMGDADRGQAYVFVHDGNSWSEQATLIASDGQAGDEFGTSLALQGERLVVGAPRDDDGGFSVNSDTGVCFDFQRSGLVWTQLGKILPLQTSVRFGGGVAFDGNWLLVGSFLDKDLGLDAGSAHLYRLNLADNFVQTDELHAGDAQALDGFGQAVAISGDAAVVSGQFDDDVAFNAGAAYFFSPSGNLCNPLYALSSEISLTNGGSQIQWLHVPAFPGRIYWVVASLGTAPGFTYQNAFVPLNVDPVYLLSLKKANSAIWSGSLGFLNGSGQAVASFNVPAATDPGLVGLQLFHASLVFDALTLFAEQATNPVAVTLVP